MKILSCLVPLLLVSAAPAAPQPAKAPTAPADLTISYSRGPVAADEGSGQWTDLAPLDAAKHTFVVTRGTVRFRKRTETSRKVIDEAAASAVYAVIVRERFFSLDASYRAEDVHDGSTSSVTVLANGKRHSVDVSNLSVPRYSAVVRALNAL